MMRIFGMEFGNKKEAIVPERVAMDFHNVNRSWINGNASILGGIEMYRGNGPIYFGEDNLYPNRVNHLYNISPLHHSIIELKRQLISGGGFSIDGDNKLDASKKLELSQFINYIDGKNTLEDKLSEIALDYLLHSTVYFKLYWNSDKSKVLKIERIEPSKIRLGINNEFVVDKFYQCFDWREYGRFGMKEIQEYQYGSDHRTEIIRFIDTNPEMNWYTLPSYSGSSDWIEFDGQIGAYQKSNIENSVNPSLIFKFSQPASSEEEKRNIIRNIQQQGRGVKNTGRSMVFFGDGDNLPEIQTVEVSNIDKQFNITADAIQRNICSAHQVDPMIMGLKLASSLGNGTEYELVYERFIKSVIQPAQRDIQSMINKLFKLKGLDVKLILNDNILYTPKNNKNL